MRALAVLDKTLAVASVEIAVVPGNSAGRLGPAAMSLKDIYSHILPPNMKVAERIVPLLLEGQMSYPGYALSDEELVV